MTSALLRGGPVRGGRADHHPPYRRTNGHRPRAHPGPLSESLVEAGVRIFEYTPGFIHAKSFAVDDALGRGGDQ